MSGAQHRIGYVNPKKGLTREEYLLRSREQQRSRPDAFSKEEDDLLRRLYADPSVTLEEIARRLNVLNGGRAVRTWSSVKNRRMALQIPPRPKTGINNGVTPAIPPAKEAEFKTLWLRGTTYSLLMRHFGCSKSSIDANRRRLKLPPRKIAGQVERDCKFHMYVTYQMSKAMERRAMERQTSVTEYVRYLIKRDCGL